MAMLSYLSPPAARNPQSSPQPIYTISDGCFRRRLILFALRCGLRFLCTRWRKLLDDDPSQQRVGPQDGKLVLHIITVDAAIVDDGIQAWSLLALLEQDLGCRGVERGRAHKIDHAHEEHECRN